MFEVKNKIYYKKLTYWLDPEIIFTSFFGKEDYSFWLDSSKVEEGLSRFSYMGDVCGPLAKKIHYTVAKQMLTVTEKKKNKHIHVNVFAYLEKELEYWKRIDSNLPFDFAGGFVGYFGYEVHQDIRTMSFLTRSGIYQPDAYFYFVDRFLAFDHKENEVYLVCLSEKKKEAEEWFEEIELRTKNLKQRTKNRELRTEKQEPKIKNGEVSKVNFRFHRNHQQYLKDIKACQEYLKNGESYQICLTNRITTDAEVEWLPLYKILRQQNPAPYSAYMRFGNFAVLSSSPEMFMKIDRNRNITSKPIKGTAKRGGTEKEDTTLAEGLGKTEKEYAENVMIVDLVRNDLGKVCKIGSIAVPKLLAVETYATVHQLVSTITGQLRDDVSIIDAIKAAFPGGSMTGAPKLRAMDIISLLEKRPRGIYSGALGFLSVNGTSELSIVIRTIIATKKTLSIGSGGAILLQSDPESEYNEMLLKAEVLMKAIEEAAGRRGL